MKLIVLLGVLTTYVCRRVWIFDKSIENVKQEREFDLFKVQLSVSGRLLDFEWYKRDQTVSAYYYTSWCARSRNRAKSRAMLTEEKRRNEECNIVK